MKDELNDWYRGRFHELKQEPPAEVWDGISERLDLQEVWGGVNKGLDAYERRKALIRRFSYSIAALLLLLGGSAWYLRQSARGPRGLAMNERYSNNTSSLSYAYHTVHSGNNSPVNYTSHSTVPGPVTAGHQDQQSTTINPVNDHLTGQNDQRHHSAYANTHGQPPVHNPLSPPSLAPSPVDGMQNVVVEYIPMLTFPVSVSFAGPEPSGELRLHDDIVPYVQPPSAFTGFYAGLVYTYNNSWLLNVNTISAYSGVGLDQADLHLAHSTGFTAGYNFSRRFGIQLDAYSHMLQGQNYHVYSEGRYMAEKTDFSYRRFDLSGRLRKETNLSGNIPSAHNLILGLQALSLRSANQTLSDSVSEITSHYSRYDLGLHVGYEYEIRVLKNVLLSASLNGNIGLLNIYKGNDHEPGDFRKTYNASVGVNAGIRYLFTRKK